jgi:Pvc16 N-terminal domain
MIFEALELIRAELQTYIRSFTSTPATVVELGSIANTAAGQEKILVSLVNMEEENTLKNISPYQRNSAGGFDIHNPPIFLNLYVLISVNFTNYSSALMLLGRVIQCFQSKRFYTVANTPNTQDITDLQASMLRITVDLYPLSFEKINQLWGTLGGKQVPSACYKIRVVEEQADKQIGSSVEMTAIEMRGQDMSKRMEN